MPTTTTIPIRARPAKLGVSRVDLAVSSGVSPTYLQLLESGDPPHGHALQRVLRRLDELEAQADEPEEAA